MLPRTYRLPGKLVMRTILRGSRWQSASLRINSNSSSWPTSRVAITVPKKIDKRAVVRNTIRRQIASIMLPILKSTQRSQSISIYVKRLVNFAGLKQEIEQWAKNWQKT